MLVLYLEGRVRTATFPYPPEGESYSPDEMRDVVAYASAKDIDVVPATQALAHAELFLKYPEMEPLSELRDTDRMGRWTTPAPCHETFCPQLPGARTFLQDYFTELAEIFPSPYFHPGLDEAWHIGICSLCRDYPGGQEAIFIECIKWLHSLLTEKLGKRMIIWDDMFQHYPKALEEIPKDIVLCCWHYDSPISDIRWHFGGRERYDKLTCFSEMGFDCLIGPADFTLSNPRTFTEYALDRPCLGGLLTMWEKGNSFYYESFPIIAFTGLLWNGIDASKAFDDTIEYIFGESDLTFRQTIKTAAEFPASYWRGDVQPEMLLRGTPTHEFQLSNSCTELLSTVASGYQNRITTPMGRLVFEDIIARLEAGNLQAEIRGIIPMFFNPQEKPSKRDYEQLDGLIQKLEVFYDKRSRFWEGARPGLAAKSMDGYWTALIDNLQELKTKAPSGLMTLSLFGPFMPLGIQDTEILVRFDDSGQWQSIVDTRLTGYGKENLYERSFAFPNDRIPIALRFETRGYGQQAIRYVKIINAKGRFVPADLTSVKGLVLEPENIFVDNNFYVTAGENYTIDNFNNHSLQANHRRHGFEISMKTL